jgi:hypothetical protein
MAAIWQCSGSFWGNLDHGDCVTAEEAFAKACNNPEIFISDNEVITWATNYGILEGTSLTKVMQLMQNGGFLLQGGNIYDDGGYPYAALGPDQTTLALSAGSPFW